MPNETDFNLPDLQDADVAFAGVSGLRDAPVQPRTAADLEQVFRTAYPRVVAVALVLRHSGLSYAEVAVALDLSPGSVGTTVRRAESALRKELNRHASSD